MGWRFFWCILGDPCGPRKIKVRGPFLKGSMRKTKIHSPRREFEEEAGFKAVGKFLDLGTIRQKSGKRVTAWAFEGDCDPANLNSNTFEIEWSPRSRRRLEIPEVDGGQWFSFNEARKYIREEQRPL